jgi:hypothetical protein
MTMARLSGWPGKAPRTTSGLSSVKGQSPLAERSLRMSRGHSKVMDDRVADDSGGSNDQGFLACHCHSSPSKRVGAAANAVTLVRIGRGDGAVQLTSRRRSRAFDESLRITRACDGSRCRARRMFDIEAVAAATRIPSLILRREPV